MKDINAVTEVPAVLAQFYPSLEEFKAEVSLVIKNSDRNDELMAMMFGKLTTAEADAVKDEIADIAKKMNDVLVKRIGKPKGLETVVAVMEFGRFMHEYGTQESRLTPEQWAILRASGSFQELLRGKRTAEASQ